MSRFLPSCAEAAALVSRTQDAPAGPLGRTRLWMHLAVCRVCRRYRRQVLFLRSIVSQYPTHAAQRTGEHLSEAAQRTIIDRLREMP